VKAPTTRRAGKEIVPEYDSDSNTAPGYAPDSNPLSGFYSDSAYEFDFGSDPEESESEDSTTEQPLSGPAYGLVITSTLSYGTPWAHYLSGYQDRLLGGPLGLPNLRCTVPDGVKHKDYRGEVLG
jgi:hypothetical protein